VRAEDVVALYRALDGAGVRTWLIGGWGIDGLLKRQTRPHHDLDLLVEISELPRFLAALETFGFEFAYVWEENRWLPNPGTDAAQPTAFVLRHADGREVDVHVLRITGNGRVTPLWDAPLEFLDDALSGHGLLGDCAVRCFSPDMQRRAHTGYDLPAQHVEDLRLLAKAYDNG
jgi:lincosamide nucleotidyltransferase A/C/D/E